MKNLFSISLAVAFVAMGSSVHAAGVVRPAPDFSLAQTPTRESLKSHRGQTVVLVITRNTRDKQFRDQVERLQTLYSQFATEKVLFVAAIKEGSQDVKSNIPFAVVANPEQVAANYGVTGRFAIAVIGLDGNLDMITTKVIAAERVRDVSFNNFQSQSNSRKALSSS